MDPNIRKTDVYVNGIILTPEAIVAIDQLQTGGTLCWDNYDKRTFDNRGLKSSLEDINDLQNYFVKRIVEDDESELKTNREMLLNIESLRYWLNMFALPDELLTPEKSAK